MPRFNGNIMADAMKTKFALSNSVFLDLCNSAFHSQTKRNAVPAVARNQRGES